MLLLKIELIGREQADLTLALLNRSDRPELMKALARCAQWLFLVMTVPSTDQGTLIGTYGALKIIHIHCKDRQPATPMRPRCGLCLERVS